MNAKKWLLVFGSTVVVLFLIVGADVVRIDPYFHYHQPLKDKYFYAMDAATYMNDGIAKNFDYTAVITGTSMTENFKASELDDLFGMQTIKISHSGARFEVINATMGTALKYNPDLKLVVRSIDMGFFLEDNKGMFQIAKDFPEYLYDKNPWNDYRYLYDRDVVFRRVATMEIEKFYHTKTPRTLSFDEYLNWMGMDIEFGKEAIYPVEKDLSKKGKLVFLAEEEKENLITHIQDSVSNICDQYPKVQFYYFFPPYSAAWWQLLVEDGTIEKQLEAEKLVIEELLQHPNIKLFSFNLFTDTTCNLDNYIDEIHYGEWVNSDILKWMKNEEGRITTENYVRYLEEEKKFYTSFEYNQLLK